MHLTAKQNRPRQFQKLARMMDQQFWRWGCDVKHDSGNLLVKYGFERIPPANQELATSSVYRLKPKPSFRLVLLSFVVFYGDDRLGGLLLKRFDANPYRAPAPDLEAMPYHESDLPPLIKSAPDNAKSSTLLADLIEQIIAYETWVRTAVGNDYVQKTLEKRQKRPVASAGEAESKWETMAQQFRRNNLKLA